MTFSLSTTDGLYGHDQAERLKALGFKFEPSPSYVNKDYPWMKDGRCIPEIEMDSLEELRKFIKKYGEIVMKEDSIEIYDGYRE